ncbi:50S ribosomal protein L11 methyltransferase [Orrella marina]|uniref:Ribosomal protein L11 methyltransferase n=1 Tax=Orrella marina TaxID=2163011 RepID=A0A2R4XN17_9BURK|nr:50S ribosomal protein L11 methyltransferase [Orrella marina]AWB35164.1 50S ribosomal protein L11 methyltransferase [Orrella marina]
MRELILYCSGQLADDLTDALIEAGALSASVEDADLDTPDEKPQFGEPGSDATPQGWDRSRLLVLLPDGLDPHQLVEQVQAEFGISIGDWDVREVPDQDWVRLTQSQFGPIEVSDRILIVPTWHSADVDPMDERVKIELDPGLAFGTGSHPTTHLCLRWLSDCLPDGVSVLDYGCGSGILAIAARLVGARDVWAIDIDEQAVDATRLNASANAVVLQAGLPKDLPSGEFDVVVANILSNPLKVLAPMLSKRVRPGGHLVLSGILERQAEEVARFYEPWIPMQVWQAQDGWVCLVGERPEEAV